MTLKPAMPRLLPMTILVTALLLMLKTVALLRAAVPPPGVAGALGGNVVSPALAATPATPAAAPAHKPTATGPAPVGKPSPIDLTPGLAAPGPTASIPTPPPSGAPATLSPGERAVLLDLRKRRAELDARAKALDERSAVLAAAEARLKLQIAQMQKLHNQLLALQTAQKKQNDQRWQNLVNVYQAMRPADAARIFDGLHMSILLEVLARMNDRKAAPILAAMSPTKARLATEALAARRNPGTGS